MREPKAPSPGDAQRQRSERLANLLDWPDLSTARNVTTKLPLVRNLGAGCQLRDAVTHERVLTVKRRM